MASVLIAGCGYVGTALGSELLGAGHRVWALRRNVAQLPVGLEPIQADLNDPLSLSSLPAEIEYLVYCASADESTDAAYVRAYISGLAHVLAALGRQRLRHVFFTSSTAVYAQADGQWVDEESETAPTHFAGVRVLEAEHLLRSSPVASTVLRCSGIYGPGRTRLIDAVRQRQAKASPRYTNRIHRDDIAGAVAHLLGNPQAPRILVLNDDEPAPESEVVAYLAQRLRVVAPAASVEAAPVRGGNKRCRNARLKGTGYRLRYPTYREGYSQILAV